MVAEGTARTAQLALLRLKQALGLAVSADLLPRNLANGVKASSSKATERQTWTREQARAFLAAAEGDTYDPLWLLLLSTGLRRGEALGLRWRDLDLDRATLSVRQSVVILAGKDERESPTRHSRAEVARRQADD